MTAAVRLPAISTMLLGFFRRIVRGYFRRGFHGVRLRGIERLPEVGGPLIVYANHSSWWDPMVCILLAERLMPARAHYAPMDASALERYGLLRRLGMFGVEMDSARGAVGFLRTGAAVLASGGVLWVTPQGRFADVRERPLGFKPGLAGLAARVATAEGSCTVLPLAIEYTFWNERTPECLLSLGEAVRITAGSETAAVSERLEGALLGAMDDLREVALRRDGREFLTLIAGRAGTGGFYALGQRLRAFATRREYRAEHTPVETGGRS